MDYLFIGKRKDNGEWVPGFYVCLGGVHVIYTGYVDTDYGENVPEMYEVMIETVEQLNSLEDITRF